MKKEKSEKKKEKKKQKQLKPQLLYVEEEIASKEKEFSQIHEKWKQQNVISSKDESTPENKISENDAAMASLLGLAWGDALGCPVEGFKWYEIKRLYSKDSEEKLNKEMEIKEKSMNSQSTCEMSSGTTTASPKITKSSQSNQNSLKKLDEKLNETNQQKTIEKVGNEKNDDDDDDDATNATTTTTAADDNDDKGNTSHTEGFKTWKRKIYDEGIIDYYTSFPVQYPPLNQIRHVGGIKFMRKLRPLGLHSDDTQQAMALIYACISQSALMDIQSGNSFDVNVWKDIIVDGWKYSAWRGIGGNFTDASKKLLSGESTPKESGSNSIGIGSSMRIPPIGALLRNHSVDVLANVVYESSLMTHGTLPAASMSFAIAYTTSRFTKSAKVSQIIEELPQVVAKYEKEWYEQHLDWKIERSQNSVHLVSNSLKALFTYMEQIDLKKTPQSSRASVLLGIRQKIGEIADSGLALINPNKKIFAYHANQGAALLGGSHALAMSLLPDEFYSNGKDPNNILINIVQLGYDTDTVAAICGGLLGARFGTQWIPTQFLLDSENIHKYALALVSPNNDNISNPKQSLEPLEEFMKRESIFTAIEKRMQKEMKNQAKHKTSISSQSQL